MAITSQDHYIEYVITPGEAARLDYPFAFPVKAVSDIVSMDIDASGQMAEISTGDYTVTPSASGLMAGGNVNLTRPLAVGHRLRIQRQTPLTQSKVFLNQNRIPPSEIEDGFDRAIMIAQELTTEIELLEGSMDEVFDELSQIDADAISVEAQARIEADVALDQRIDDEGEARAAGDNALLQHIDDITSNLDVNKMPLAPDDGKIYVGSGGTWTPLKLEVGDPFVIDSDGYAVIVKRPAYFPNRIWDIHPDYLVLSEASQPGDMDSVFTVDAEGYVVIQ